jgi:acyl-coenzyme A synthetase/AMP-(fatty) acid ligase
MLLHSIDKRYRIISRHQNQILTYDQLDQKSNALARGLSNNGVKKGDRCAVMLGNNVEFATVRANNSRF